MEPTRCLLSLRDSRSLLAPLGESKRMKYTCIASSSRYVALGANTGGVYCFHRDGYKFVRILANKEGGVSLLRFSPASDNVLAAVTGAGYVAVWELNLHEQGESKRFHVSPLLKDSTIRDIVWDSKGTRLFYGDDVGRVGVAYIPKQKLFKKPDEVCLLEKSPIVQLDYHHEILLVSTQQRCLLLKPSTREALQVGRKTRDGQFGACFHSRWPDRPPVVYSARPGGRLWEADIEGTVLSTLKLKDLVVDGPTASPIFGIGFQPDVNKSSKHPPPKLLHFPYLFVLHNTYMVGVADHTLFLFNPASYKLSAWSCDLGTVQDVYCDGQQLFAVCGAGRSVMVLDFMDLGTCVCELVKQSLLDQAVMVVDKFSSEVQHALFHDAALYKAVKSALLTRSTFENNSSGLRSVQAELDGLKEKFETDHGGEIETVDPTDQKVEIERVDDDGYQTIDLNTYSGTDLTDTVDAEGDEAQSETVIVNGLEEVKVVMDNEPDLDSTLMNDEIIDHNDTGDHSDTDIDTASSQTKLTVEQISEHSESPLLDQINVGQADVDTDLTQVDILTQSDHLASDLPTTPADSAIHVPPTRSQSKAIPPREQVTSKHEDSAHDVSSSSFTPSSSLGGQNRISLSEPQSLERQVEMCGESPLSLGGSVGNSSVTSSLKSREKSDFAQRVETALNSQLSISSVVSTEGEDDLIAIPVGAQGGAGGGGESTGGTSRGGKGKKKKSRRKKNTISRRMSSPEIRDPSLTKPSSPGRSLSLHHILEEETLPFPEAGLPPTPPSRGSHPHTPHSSEPTSLTASPYPSLPSTPPRHSQPLADLTQLGKNASALFSKVKTLTTHLAEKVETQQTQKQVKNVVKDIFSSLSSVPQHSHGGGVANSGSHDPWVMSSSQHVFQNNDFALPLALSPPSEPEMGEFAALGSPPTASSDQSDGRISAPMSPPPALMGVAVKEETSCDPKLAEFSKNTMEAISGLEDPLVLCSGDEMTSLLANWLSSLELLAVHLTSPTSCHSPSHTIDNDNHRSNYQENVAKQPPSADEISKALLGPVYHSLSPVVKATVTELATLCAEMEVYGCEFAGRSSDEMSGERVSTGAGEKINTSDISVDKSRPAQPEAVMSERDNLPSPSPTQPDEGERGHTTNTETPAAIGDGMFVTRRCTDLVEFVSCYGPLLDSVRLKKLLSSREWEERKTCSTILAEQDKQVLTDNHPSSTSEDVLPVGDLKMIASKPDEFLKYCVEHFPVLLPWEVAVVCGISQWDYSSKSHDSHMDQSDTTLHSLYADYLKQLFSEADESLQVNSLLSSMFKNDQHLLMNSLSVLLQLGGCGLLTPGDMNDCAIPSSWSHTLHHQQHGHTLERLVELLMASDNLELIESARKMCQKYKFWVGVVHLSVAIGDKRTALYTLLKLRDKRLFSGSQKWGNLLTKFEDWEILMELINGLDTPLLDKESADSALQEIASGEKLSRDVADQSVLEYVSIDQPVSISTADEDKDRNECCYATVAHGNDLTQIELLKLMLTSLPPLMVSKLLSHCHGNSFGGKTREQLHSLLSKLTSIHTQQRSLGHTMLERVDSYLWSQRPSAVGPHVVAVQNVERNAKQEDAPSGNIVQMTSLLPTSSTMEDANAHWGVVVGKFSESRDHCPICTLPVSKSVSDLHPGALIFQCGHAYHKLCLPEQACLVCFNKNCRTSLVPYLEQV